MIAELNNTLHVTAIVSSYRRLGVVPQMVDVVGPGVGHTVVELVTTAAGFGGLRYWLKCPRCWRRTNRLYFVFPGPMCRVCARIKYPSSQLHRNRSWHAWGRAARQLARIRQQLARPRLRLAHRGRLERLAHELAAEVVRGLDLDLRHPQTHPQ